MSAPVVRFAPVSDEWLLAADRTGSSGVPELPAEVAARLAPWEHERYRRHRTPLARAAYASAHLLARDCLAELLGEAVDFAQQCDGCGGTDHGAPYVLGGAAYVSLSHSRGWVAAMAAYEPCGIDVQVVSRVPDRALTLPEREVATDDVARSVLWARKEATIKSGLATLADLGELDVLHPDPRLQDWAHPAAPVSVVGAWITLTSR